MKETRGPIYNEKEYLHPVALIELGITEWTSRVRECALGHTRVLIYIFMCINISYLYKVVYLFKDGIIWCSLWLPSII